MGTWGYNPKDSDGANDSVDVVMVRGITLELISYFNEIPSNTSDYWEHLGVVQLLSVYHKIPFSILQKCLDYIEVCLADKNWIKSWNYPDAFIESANDFKQRLENIVQKAETEEGIKARMRGMGSELDLVETPELAETREWEPPRNSILS